MKSSSYYDAPKSMSYEGGLRSSPTIGDVDLQSGMSRGSGGLSSDGPEAMSNRHGKQTVYHLRFVGVKPEVARVLSEGGKLNVARILDSYPHLN